MLVKPKVLKRPQVPKSPSPQVPKSPSPQVPKRRLFVAMPNLFTYYFISKAAVQTIGQMMLEM